MFLYGRAAERARKLELRGLEISLSHSRDFAVASVVGERALSTGVDTPSLGEAAQRMVREEVLR